MIDGRYRAFISYSHLDRERADWLQRALETYRVPGKLVDKMTSEGSVPRRLTPIFRDVDYLPSSGDLPASVEDQLRRSRFLIVACSPNAAASEWVGEEVQRFKSVHGEARVLLAVVGGKPGDVEGDPLDPEAVAPKSALFRVSESGALTDERVEPLAADLRFAGKASEKNFLKLVAGLIGVGLDDLLERDHQRRNARMRAIAGVAAASAFITGALSFMAIDARNDAQEHRAEAEDLIEFMLTDLRAELEPVGRLDALDVVGRRALDYYARRSPKQMDPDSLGRRARAQLLVGELRNLRGDLDAALDAYEEAAATTGEQLRRDPANELRIFDHAQSVFWVGYVALQRGNLPLAERYFREYHALAGQLVRLDSDNADWRLELAYANNNLGTLFANARRWDEAIDYLEEARALKSRLVSDSPEDIAAAMSLAQSWSWLGRTRWDLGEYDAARRAFESESDIYNVVLNRRPDDAGAKRARLLAVASLASIKLETGDIESAHAGFEEAHSAASRLLAVEPGDTFTLRIASHVARQYGEALVAAGETEAARETIREARDYARQLVQRDSEVQSWRTLEYGAALAQIGMMNASERKATRLRSLADDLEILTGDAESSVDLKISLAEINFVYGNTLDAIGSPDAARAAWSKAESILLGLGGALRPREKILKLKLLIALRRAVEADDLRSELELMGLEAAVRKI